MTESTLDVRTTAQGVTTLTLSRPDKHNALDQPLIARHIDQFLRHRRWQADRSGQFADLDRAWICLRAFALDRRSRYIPGP